ncbi:hypothetical protein [Chamaesiphon sp. VAR_48_metabat_135_sub]|uniref:hypothetical protein n=1 Tax=Chamaesiphon sp. VAR_48_metabat_135_sub TaxID=2964699 RepID=UPI00286B23DA|nr:hypothetical protein [Chamaesiphon sp. VAR_48_metabat_135_sub]
MKFQQFSQLIAISTVSAAACLLSVGTAQAATIVLDFEGVGDFAPVGNFYNGGAGTNYGIDFSTTALGLVDSDNGGSGDFANEPSPNTIMFFDTGAAATMNVAAGFDTGFSFFYTTIGNPGSVTVYDGLNGTGNILATLVLSATPSTGNGDPNGAFDVFASTGVTFSGIAKSVDFGGVANQIGFDDITLGSAIAGGGGQEVPEPFTIVGTLIGGTAAFRMKKNLKSSNKA